MFCLKSRKIKTIPITGCHKWMIYLTGLLETLLFSSCVFGWPQLVYVLKNDAVYLNLCQSEDFTTGSNDSNVSEFFVNETLKLRGCLEQDKVFALVYTIGCISNSGIGIFSAMSLYYFGLVITRTISATALVLGFLTLGLTDKESPHFIYISIILISFGGGALRITGLQFCNLFPKWRSTALAIISGSYSASSGMFLLFQIGQQYGVSLWNMSFVIALVASGSLFVSVIMPWHHIPYDIKEQETMNKSPIKNSVFSISNFSSYFWFVITMIALRSYTLWFNPWISHIFETREEVAFYSLIFSIGAYLSPIVSPLPGILNDKLIQKIMSTYPNKKKRLEKELKIPLYTLALMILVMMVIYVCLLFNNKVAIYVSIVLVQIARPSLVSVSSAFYRIRFPPEHFERLHGFQSIIITLVVPLQYPLFVWSQKSKTQVITAAEILFLASFFHPLHLLSKKYRVKIVKERFAKTEKDQERSENLETEKDQEKSENLETEKYQGRSKNLETEKDQESSKNLLTEKDQERYENLEIGKGQERSENLKIGKDQERSENLEIENDQERSKNLEAGKDQEKFENWNLKKIKKDLKIWKLKRIRKDLINLEGQSTAQDCG